MHMRSSMQCKRHYNSWQTQQAQQQQGRHTWDNCYQLNAPSLTSFLHAPAMHNASSGPPATRNLRVCTALPTWSLHAAANRDCCACIQNPRPPQCSACRCPGCIAHSQPLFNHRSTAWGPGVVNGRPCNLPAQASHLSTCQCCLQAHADPLALSIFLTAPASHVSHGLQLH